MQYHEEFAYTDTGLRYTCPSVDVCILFLSVWALPYLKLQCLALEDAEYHEKATEGECYSATPQVVSRGVQYHEEVSEGACHCATRQGGSAGCRRKEGACHCAAPRVGGCIPLCSTMGRRVHASAQHRE